MSIFDPEHGYAATTVSEEATITREKLIRTIEEAQALMKLPKVIIICHPSAIYEGEKTMQEAMDEGLIDSGLVLLNTCIGVDEAYKIDKCLLEAQLPVLPTMEMLMEEVDKSGLEVEDLSEGYC
jgi:hypothetical protein